MPEKTIIEVNGVKLEVDLRTARRVDELRVGDRVKVLVTESYSGTHKVHAGTIVGFEPFPSLPTVIVAYLVTDWSGVGVKFVYFNKQSKDVEIIKSIDDDQLDIDRSGVLHQFEAEIQKRRDEIIDLERKRDYFVANFKAYWPDMQIVVAANQGE